MALKMQISVQVEEAEAQGKYVILINPLLKDIPSAGGVMQTRCGHLTSWQNSNFLS